MNKKDIIDTCRKHFIPEAYQNMLLNKKSLQKERERITEANIIAFASGRYDIDFSEPKSLRFWILRTLMYLDRDERGKLIKKATYANRLQYVVDIFVKQYIGRFMDMVMNDKAFAEQFEGIVYSGCPDEKYKRTKQSVEIYTGENLKAVLKSKSDLLRYLGLAVNSSNFRRLSACIHSGYEFHGYIVKEV